MSVTLTISLRERLPDLAAAHARVRELTAVAPESVLTIMIDQHRPWGSARADTGDAEPPASAPAPVPTPEGAATTPRRGRPRKDTQVPASDPPAEQPKEDAAEQAHPSSSSTTGTPSEASGSETPSPQAGSPTPSPESKSSSETCPTDDELRAAVQARIKADPTLRPKALELLKTYGVDSVTKVPLERRLAFVADLKTLA